MKIGTVNLEQWTRASIEERSRMLQDGILLDSESGIVLRWDLTFKDAGAIVSDDTMLRVWDAYRMRGR